MKTEFKINNVQIGEDHPPYVICELSANHNGSLEKALELVDRAAETGCAAIKIQTYSADTMTLDSDKPDFVIEEGLWKGETLYSLYGKAYTPWEWHAEIIAAAKRRGLTAFSTPFDATAVEFLETLGVPAYKVASFELTDLRLVKRIGITGKPVIISTGMGSDNEIEEAIAALGHRDFALLHCVSAYPTPTKEMNLQRIVHLREKFGCVVGLSDHSIDNTSAVASVALGAALVEKHFTLDRKGGGPDDSFSLEPDEFTALVNSTKDVWSASRPYRDTNLAGVDTGSRRFRRSLYFAKDLLAGHILTADDIRIIRPGFGLPPKHYDQVLGRTLTKDVEAADRVTHEVVDL